MRLMCGLTVLTGLVLGSSASVLAQGQNQAPRAQVRVQAESQEHAEHAEIELPKFGIAVLTPTADNKVRGVLRLQQVGEDLQITGKIRNLTPGAHGFHIHEFGDMRGTDGSAAGGHFNPYGHDHGAPNEKSHVGDLGNIIANDQGIAQIDVTAKNTPLHFVLGRAFIVHAGKDDLQSQPSGDAGARVARGVIGVGNEGFEAPETPEARR